MMRLVERIAHSLRRVARPRIAVLDDLFPHPMSGIRFEEFSSYLDEMPEVSVSVHCDGDAFRLAGGPRPVEVVIAEHLAAHSRHIGRVHPLRPGQLPDADAYYAVFLHNISRYLDAIERSKKPFAFTLYPGGSFRVGKKSSDDKLDRVCNSPFLRKIIVTQRYTLDYLLKRHPQSESKFCYLPGGVIPRLAFHAPKNRKHFGVDKDVLEIGFVANRYTPKGEDGKLTEVANASLKFCEAYAVDQENTRQFSEAIAEHDLLEVRNITLALPKGKITLQDVRVISPRKFEELPDSVYLEWRKKRWLFPVYSHLQSGLNWQRLVGRAAARQS